MVKKQVHGAQISSGDDFHADLCCVCHVESEPMTLSVEGIAIVSHWTIERFQWEVNLGTVLFDFHHSGRAQHLFLSEGVRETVLFLLSSMVSSYEKVLSTFSRNKNTRNQWLPKTGDWC